MLLVSTKYKACIYEVYIYEVYMYEAYNYENIYYQVIYSFFSLDENTHILGI